METKILLLTCLLILWICSMYILISLNVFMKKNKLFNNFNFINANSINFSAIFDYLLLFMKIVILNSENNNSNYGKIFEFKDIKDDVVVFNTIKYCIKQIRFFILISIISLIFLIVLFLL